MIKSISIQFKSGKCYGGYAVFYLKQKQIWEYIYFDANHEKFPRVVVQRSRKKKDELNLSFTAMNELERELTAAFFVHNMPLELGTFDVPEIVNEYNRKVEMEMEKLNTEATQVCLLMNLGGFENKTDEYLRLASTFAKSVYALTGDGLCNVDDGFQVPVNVNRLTKAELRVWSLMINEELQQAGFPLDQVIILAAGKHYCGQIPLGMIIRDDIRIGA